MMKRRVCRVTCSGFILKGVYYKLKNTFIETERLVIRGYKTEDLEDYYDYAKDDRVCLSLGRTTLKSVSEAEKQISKRMTSETNIYMAVADKENDRFMGSISIGEDRKRENSNCLEIGFSLSFQYWKKGYMSEALTALLEKLFRECEIDLVTVYRFTDNENSEKLIKRMGFVEEGTLRYSAKSSDGIVKDEVCYSMTKEEFNKLFHVEH